MVFWSRVLGALCCYHLWSLPVLLLHSRLYSSSFLATKRPLKLVAAQSPRDPESQLGIGNDNTFLRAETGKEGATADVSESAPMADRRPSPEANVVHAAFRPPANVVFD